MQIDLTQITIAIIGVVTAIITGAIIPLIKSKLTAEQWKTLRNYAVAAVQAAEILYGAGNGQEKLQWVMNYIKEQCEQNKIKFDEQSIRIAIENAWKQLGFDK